MEPGSEAQQAVPVRRVCVYCGHRAGFRPVYEEATRKLGEEMVQRELDLVYGGGSVGLMGVIAQTVQQGGRKVVGIIPHALVKREVSGETLGEQVLVADMHQRKAEMARRSDAFIALPGGFGTLEELLEMCTWSQLGIHTKPVGVLDIDGYYAPLLAFFDQAVQEGFIAPQQRSLLVSAPTATELLDKLQRYQPVQTIVPPQSWARLGYDPATEGISSQN